MRNTILRVLVMMMLIFLFTLSGCEEKCVDLKSETNKMVQVDETETELPMQTKTEIETESETSETTSENLTICIDPGHYTGQNVLYFEDGTSYCEGDVTLLIAKELQTILLEEYGIQSILTRENGTMTVNGLSNDELNGIDLEPRGEMAEGCDLFVSIHTNANNDWANGYETCTQPISINKPILIANMAARYDYKALKIGNAIGNHITQIYREMELGTAEVFQENMDGNSIIEWTDELNDRLNIGGTVCIRTGDYGEDYYGVLRGAARVGVPGFIIEHGFHTVPEFRKAIHEGDLIRKLAEADARGIAEGFGLIQ